MKKIMVAVLALALVALAVTLVVLSLDSTGDERVGLSILSVKVEAERLSKIGVTFPSPGNAAGTYVPYLKGEAQITKEEWFQKIGFSTLDDSNDGDRELLEKGVRLAGKDIEAVLKAGRMAESKVWGEYYKPDPSVNVYAQELPLYINLVRLGVLTIAKGNQPG